MTLTRRTTLAILGGATLAIGAGAALVVTMSDEDLVHAVLERHLGPVNMTDDDLSEFLMHFRERRPWLFPTGQLATLYKATELVDLADITRKNLSGGRRETIVRFERGLLGDFHRVTDVGFRSSPEDEIYFVGPDACLNPFAQLA